MHQVAYYNQFGEEFRQAILTCPQPHLWTTDYRQKGPVYQQLKERVLKQQSLVEKYFATRYPVLDIGCGFGRQAHLLATLGLG